MSSSIRFQNKRINSFECLLLGIPILSWALVYFMLGFDRLTGQDAYEYARYSDSWLNYLQNGQNPGNYFWPMLYPVLGALISFITFLPVEISLQLISVLSISISSFLLFRITSLFFNIQAKWSFGLIAIFYCFSAYNFRIQMMSMTDALASMLCLSVYYYFFWYRKNSKPIYLLLIALLASAAINTRYISLLLVLLPLFFAVLQALKTKSFISLLLMIPLVLFPCIPHVLIRWETLFDFIHHEAVSEWSLTNYFIRPEFYIQRGNALRLPNALYVLSPFFHPGYLLIGFLALFGMNQKLDFNRKIVLFSILIYLLYFAGLNNHLLPQNLRYFVTVFPLVALLSFSWIAKAIESYFVAFNPKLVSLAIVALILIQFAITSFTFNSSLKRNQLEQNIAKYFEDKNGLMVYSYGMNIAMKYRNKSNDFLSLHEREIDWLPTNGYILAHDSWSTGRLEKLSPGLVFSQLKSTNRIGLKQNFGQHWKLYTILE